jgi:hypothetical protein
MGLRTINHVRYYEHRSDLFAIWDLTDIHLGHAGCDEAMLDADIAAIAADPNAYWIGGGDYIDAIPRLGDKRYSEASYAKWLHGETDVVGLQVERITSKLAPIAHKCLAMRRGNHEDSILTHYDRDVYREIVRGVATAARCEMRDIALGAEGFVHLRFRRGKPGAFGGVTSLVIYCHHGAGGGRKRGGDALRMEEILLQYRADIVIMGHRHKSMIFPVEEVIPSGRGVQLKDRLGIWGGSYLHTYIDDSGRDIPADNYPQKKHLPPTKVGMVPVVVKPDVMGLFPVLVTGGMTAAQVIAAMRGVQPTPPSEPLVLPVRRGVRLLDAA